MKTTTTKNEAEAAKGNDRTKQKVKKATTTPTTRTMSKSQPDRNAGAAIPSRSSLELRPIAKPPDPQPPLQQTAINIPPTSKNASARSTAQSVPTATQTSTRTVPSTAPASARASSTRSPVPCTPTANTASGLEPKARPTLSSAVNMPGVSAATPTDTANQAADSSTTQGAQEQRQPTAAERIEHRAKLLKTSVFAAKMSTAIMLDGSFDTPAYRLFLEQLMTEMGDPSDRVERMMIEQLAMTHLRLGDLAGHAAHAKGNELIKIANAATARFLGEFRKTALALKTYRTRDKTTRNAVRKVRKAKTA
jgi:hypothetical protein